MVTLTEVEDEHFQSTQAGPEANEDDFTDTGSYSLHDWGKSICWAKRSLLTLEQTLKFPTTPTMIR